MRLWLSPSFSLSLPVCLSMLCFYCSVDNFCLSLWPMNCSMPGFPVHNQLLELTQTHVHSVGDAIQPSHPLSSPSLPALNLSQHQSLFQWVGSSHHVAKVLKLQLQHHPIHPMNIQNWFQLYSFIPLNKYFTYFSTFHLCGNFFLQSWRARARVTDYRSGSSDLVLALLWASPVSAGNPSPAPRHCRWRPLEIKTARVSLCFCHAKYYVKCHFKWQTS